MQRFACVIPNPVNSSGYAYAIFLSLYEKARPFTSLNFLVPLVSK